MKKKKILIFGGGRIAERHIQVIKFNHSTFYEIIGCIEIQKSKREILKKKYDIEVYDNINLLPKDLSVDIVVICTESGNHYKSFQECKKFTCDFLIEKPVTLKLDHAKEIINWSIVQKRNVFVVLQNRYNLAVETAEKWLNDQQIGDLKHLSAKVFWCRDEKYYNAATWRGTWKFDGGVTSNQAAHHIDLLLFFSKSKVKYLKSFMKKHINLIEAEDIMMSMMEFDNGVTCSFEATTCARPSNISAEISLIGSKGHIKISGFACNEISDYSLINIKKETDDKNYNEQPKDVYGFGHTKLYSDLEKFYDNKKNKIVKIDEGIKSLELIHLMYLSAQKKDQISYDDLKDGFFKLG